MAAPWAFSHPLHEPPGSPTERVNDQVAGAFGGSPNIASISAAVIISPASILRLISSTIRASADPPAAISTATMTAAATSSPSAMKRYHRRRMAGPHCWLKVLASVAAAAFDGRDGLPSASRYVTQK